LKITRAALKIAIAVHGFTRTGGFGFVIQSVRIPAGIAVNYKNFNRDQL